MRPAPLILISMAIAAPVASSATPATASITAGAGHGPSVRGGFDGSGHAVTTTGGNSARVGPPANVVDPQIRDGTEQRRLDRALDRWRRDRVRDYRLRLALRCFCRSEITAPATILVRGGRPHDAPSHLRRAATVPRLLRIVQRAIDERVSGLNVRYGSRGVPRSIGIDWSRGIADDELEYVVDEIRPVTVAARTAGNASDGGFPWLQAGLAGLVLALIGARGAVPPGAARSSPG